VAQVRVILAGATGRAGSEVARALRHEDGIRIVGAVARRQAGSDLGVALGGEAWDVPIHPTVAKALTSARADVLVDFTLADVAGGHALAALNAGVRPVVGATGIPEADAAAIVESSARTGLGAALIPNFSFGIMLLQRFAVEALRFYPAVEIVERHHDTKKDAPSGTAARLARVLEAAGARKPVPVHSVRLPGHVAHHEVVLGGLGEILTIRHDTTSRASWGPGVALAARTVMTRPGVAFDLADLVAEPD
jgi:4-hydroxy-tetrahydrodipicolinate reductase